MSTPTPIDDLLIEKLRTHLKAEGYSARVHRQAQDFGGRNIWLAAL